MCERVCRKRLTIRKINMENMLSTIYSILFINVVCFYVDIRTWTFYYVIMAYASARQTDTSEAAAAQADTHRTPNNSLVLCMDLDICVCIANKRMWATHTSVNQMARVWEFRTTTRARAPTHTHAHTSARARDCGRSCLPSAN